MYLVRPPFLGLDCMVDLGIPDVDAFPEGRQVSASAALDAVAQVGGDQCEGPAWCELLVAVPIDGMHSNACAVKIRPRPHCDAEYFRRKRRIPGNPAVVTKAEIRLVRINPCVD